MSCPTYLWRKLTPKQRDELMAWRKQQGLPWHRPPHRASEKTQYLAEIGREEAARLWKAYPLLDYGKGWDEAEL